MATAFGAPEQKTPIASARKKLDFPLAFAVAAPWRSDDGLTAFERIKHRITSEGPDEAALAALRTELDREPWLVFSDAGLAEATKRAGKQFLSFRERLAHRFVSPDCPELVPRFCSKTFTKRYCAERGIRIPESFLVSSHLEEIKAFAFPPRFVIKPANDSGRCTFLYDDGVDLLTRRLLKVADLLASVAEYKRKKPAAEFIIEEALRQKDAGDQRVIPLDYKLHVFGGKVRIILVVDRNVFGSRDYLNRQLYRQLGWYSADWRPAPFPMHVVEEEAIDFRQPELAARDDTAGGAHRHRNGRLRPR